MVFPLTRIAQNLGADHKYEIQERLGRGGFAEVFRALHVDTGEEVAIKCESAHVARPLLRHEAKVYSSLLGCDGFPSVRMLGSQGRTNCLVLDLLGPSLQDIFHAQHRKLPLRSVLLLADQIIARIEDLHDKSYIHRDIKPMNIMMGIGAEKNKVYIIDLGLAVKYQHVTTDHGPPTHIPCTVTSKFAGTIDFASMNTHCGVQPSRRDDMESIGLVLIYLAQGSLPWQNVGGADREEVRSRVLDLRIELSEEQLCEGLPKEFQQYFEQVADLPFTGKPDYASLRQLFKDAFLRESYLNPTFDWDVSQSQDPLASPASPASPAGS